MGSVKTFNGTVMKLTPQKKRLGNIAAGVNPDEAVNKAQLDAIQAGTVDLARIEMSADGTAAAPVITRDGDTDTGLYFIGANNIGVSANGAKVLDIATTGLAVTGLISASTTVTAGTGLVSTTTTTVGTALDIGTNVTLAKEVNHTVTVTTTTTAATAGGNLTMTSGAGATTGSGGTISVVGGASGAGATGNGGQANLTGGSAASTNGNGGDVVVTGGTLSGTGLAGNVVLRGTVLYKQGAAAAKTTDTTLTAAEIIGGILTSNQGAAGTASYTLPLATSVDTALPNSAANDAFEFSLINISTNAAEDATVITNTGWTLVGEMTVESNDNDRAASSGRFACRKTGAGAWTIYRLS